jgi:uncharacterized membrane protein
MSIRVISEFIWLLLLLLLLGVVAKSPMTIRIVNVSIIHRVIGVSDIVILTKSDYLHPWSEIAEIFLDSSSLCLLFFTTFPANEIGLKAFKEVRNLLFEFFPLVALYSITSNVS